MAFNPKDYTQIKEKVHAQQAYPQSLLQSPVRMNLAPKFSNIPIRPLNEPSPPPDMSMHAFGLGNLSGSSLHTSDKRKSKVRLIASVAELPSMQKSIN